MATLLFSKIGIRKKQPSKSYGIKIVRIYVTTWCVSQHVVRTIVSFRSGTPKLSSWRKTRQQILKSPTSALHKKSPKRQRWESPTLRITNFEAFLNWSCLKNCQFLILVRNLFSLVNFHQLWKKPHQCTNYGRVLVISSSSCNTRCKMTDPLNKWAKTTIKWTNEHVLL